MTAYHFGHGLKKPQNVIEGPMYPDIKKGPPIFVDAKKHWQVDTGAVLRESEHYDQLLNDAVLAQSRDYNRTVYGISSHRDVVNKNFRPPLLTAEDFEPLSRIRRKLTIPRVNPGTDTSTRGYLTQNSRPSNIGAHLTDRVKHGEWRPTFFCPIDMPEDNARLPVLKAPLPEYSTGAGMNTPARLDAPQQAPVLLHEEFTPLLDAGATFPVHIDGDVVRIANLPRTLPAHAAHAGVNTPAALDAESHLTQLALAPSRPAYAAGAGMNTVAELSAVDPRATKLSFQTQLDPALFTNPGADGYDGQDYTVVQSDLTAKTGFTRPQVSFENPAASQASAPNYRDLPPEMRDTIRSQVSSAGFRSGGYVPRRGLDVPQVALRPLGNKAGLATGALKAQGRRAPAGPAEYSLGRRPAARTTLVH